MMSSKPSFRVQTRLPGELAQELERIASEFETDLQYYQQAEEYNSDSEAEEAEPLRPLRNFPAVALITAMHSAIEVRHVISAPGCYYGLKPFA
jgi:hypothetical protein